MPWKETYPISLRSDNWPAVVLRQRPRPRMSGFMVETRTSGQAPRPATNGTTTTIQKRTCRGGWSPITNLEKYSDTTYVWFNNHYRGKAAKNADTLQHTLKTPRPTALPQAGPSCNGAPG